MADLTGERPSILILDDHEDTVAALAEVLDTEGFAVTTALDARTAIQRLEREAFSLVLADYLIGSPQQSESTAQRLLAAAGPTPIGCITAWYLTGPALARYAFVLTKPFSIEALLGEVGRVTVEQRGDEARRDLMRRYFAVLAARDWDGLGALCSEQVHYHLPGQHVFSGTVEGRQAFQRHIAEVLARFREVSFEIRSFSWLPRGAVARYTCRWIDASGARGEQPGDVMFTFEDGKIATIGVRLDLERLDGLLNPRS